MKEVPRKDLPEISGGESVQGGCVPLPIPPSEDGIDYPRNPFSPIYDAPYVDSSES